MKTDTATDIGMGAARRGSDTGCRAVQDADEDFDITAVEAVRQFDGESAVGGVLDTVFDLHF